MKVVLINSPIYDRLEIESAGNEYLPPFGLGYLATKIQEMNWDVIILDTIRLGLNVTQVVQRLYEMEPDIIAICQYSCRNSSFLMYPILSPGETLPLPS